MGLSSAGMVKLKKQGMPVDSVESAQAWREARQNVAQRKPVPKPKPAPAPAPAQRVEVAGIPVFGGGPIDLPPILEDRDEARTRREIAEANIAEMDEAKQRRELILVSAVQAQLSTDYATTRDAMLQIPARMGPVLAAEKDPATVQTLLHAEIHKALMTLAGAAERVPTIERGFD